MMIQSKCSSILARRGTALIYTMVGMVGFCAMVSLGVDLAHVQTTKTELQLAADSAARAAASYLLSSSANAQAAAIAAAAGNKADGAPVVLTAADVEIGRWNSSSNKFQANGGHMDAVRITARRTAATGNAVPLMFARLLGRNSCDVKAVVVAVLNTGGSSAAVRVEGIMNLYLAGMPNGTYGGASNTGTAPANSPMQVPGLSLSAGQILQLSSNGSAADDPVNINQNWTPDGQPGGLRTNDTGYLNGMSQLTAQQASLVGVFLDNNAPTVGGTPAALNFSTQAQMDYTTLSPQLKQPFFIGNGKTSGGVQQKVVVPSGATRLFIGLHDNVNWDNNSGYFLVTVNGATAKISTVQ